MSDPSGGLNLIEDNITAAGGFPRATMGGYQRQAVDEHVTYLEGQVRAARRQIRKLEDKVAELTAKVASRPRLEEIDYADLGGHAGQMLSSAQAQAREILDEARSESERVRNEAAEHTAKVRADADAEAAEIRQAGLAEIGLLRAQLETDATGEIGRAREESAALVAAAEREVESLRLAADRDAVNVREQARLEAEQVVAAATRQANELRATLAAEREQTVTELARVHAEHVDRTTTLLEEARRHHQQSQERLSADIAEASRIRTDALEQAEQIKVRSLRETEERVATADRQARVMQERMQDRFARHKDKMRREIEVLANRRKAMVTQLSQLADHVRDSTVDPDEIDDLSRLWDDEPAGAPSGRADAAEGHGTDRTEEVDPILTEEVPDLETPVGDRDGSGEGSEQVHEDETVVTEQHEQQDDRQGDDLGDPTGDDDPMRDEDTTRLRTDTHRVTT